MQPKEKNEKAIDMKMDILIANVDALQSSIKNLKPTQAQQIDLSGIEALTERMESGISATAECTAELNTILEQVKKPVRIERRYIIDLQSGKTQIAVFILIGALIGCSLIINNQRQIITHYKDNDLKYRHIKMKGEATPQRISELEDLFEMNRDNAKIKQLRQDVEAYERAIQEKTTLDEQTRLRQLEAEKLNNKAKTLKEK